MITEVQIREILRLCEKKLGEDALARLRKDLLGQRNPKQALWELLVLFSCLDAAPKILFEPTPAAPDVQLFDRIGRLLFSVEAVYVESRSRALTRTLFKFQDFIFQDIKKCQPLIVGADIQVNNTLRDGTDINIPPEHEWRNLVTRNLGVSKYSELIEYGSQKINIPEFCLSITLTKNDERFVTGGHAVPGLPKQIKEHPCYRALKKKGSQAKKWSAAIVKKPILVVMGTEDVSSEFDLDGDSVGLRQAIYGALLDSRKMEPLTRINLLRLWPENPKRLHVHGSSLLSGVLMVHLKSQLGSISLPDRNKSPERYFFPNDNSRHKIIKKLEKYVSRINFKKLVYGPGWESWDHDKDISHKDRYKWEGSSFRRSHDSDGNIIIELSLTSLLRVLSGDANLDELYSHEPMQLFSDALTEGREIVRVSSDSGNILNREASMIKITRISVASATH